MAASSFLSAILPAFNSGTSKKTDSSTSTSHPNSARLGGQSDSSQYLQRKTLTPEPEPVEDFDVDKLTKGAGWWYFQISARPFVVAVPKGVLFPGTTCLVMWLEGHPESAQSVLVDIGSGPFHGVRGYISLNFPSTLNDSKFPTMLIFKQTSKRDSAFEGFCIWRNEGVIESVTAPIVPPYINTTFCPPFSHSAPPIRYSQLVYLISMSVNACKLCGVDDRDYEYNQCNNCLCPLRMYNSSEEPTCGVCGKGFSDHKTVPFGTVKKPGWKSIFHK